MCNDCFLYTPQTTNASSTATAAIQGYKPRSPLARLFVELHGGCVSHIMSAGRIRRLRTGMQHCREARLECCAQSSCGAFLQPGATPDHFAKINGSRRAYTALAHPIWKPCKCCRVPTTPQDREAVSFRDSAKRVAMLCLERLLDLRGLVGLVPLVSQSLASCKRTGWAEYGSRWYRLQVWIG